MGKSSIAVYVISGKSVEKMLIDKITLSFCFWLIQQIKYSTDENTSYKNPICHKAVLFSDLKNCPQKSTSDIT